MKPSLPLLKTLALLIRYQPLLVAVVAVGALSTVAATLFLALPAHLLGVIETLAAVASIAGLVVVVATDIALAMIEVPAPEAN